LGRGLIAQRDVRDDCHRHGWLLSEWTISRTALTRSGKVHKPTLRDIFDARQLQTAPCSHERLAIPRATRAADTDVG
jgi:hypothetical protein